MHPVRKQRLIMVLFVVFFSAAAITLMLVALGNKVDFFYSPSQVAAGEAPVDQQVRVGGCVVRGSIERMENSLEKYFVLEDNDHTIRVSYSGSLPDLFVEGEAAVAVGKLKENKEFVATQVLAKHDENYTPPEVADALETASAEGANSDNPMTCELLQQ